MAQAVRVHNFMVSSDGYGSGAGQSFEHPFGHANPADLFFWAGATANWVNRTEPGGTYGLDDYCTRDFSRNIGAEIMGRNKFGPQRGPWENLDWQGWWGDDTPFHTPVFVLTHHIRPSITLGDTTFHFLNASPHDALAQAFEAADGKDVRIGGCACRTWPRGKTVEQPERSCRTFLLGIGTQLEWRDASLFLATLTVK